MTDAAPAGASPTCQANDRCSRQGKFVFAGRGRCETRCGTHGYEWLGGDMPEWVQAVYQRGVRTAYRRPQARRAS